MLGTSNRSNSPARDNQEGAGFMPSRDSGQLTPIYVMASAPLHPEVHPANTKTNPSILTETRNPWAVTLDTLTYSQLPGLLPGCISSKKMVSKRPARVTSPSDSGAI